MKKIMSHPVLLGIGIAFVIGGGIIVMETWFPWVGAAWDSHKRLVQAVWFTAISFIAWINQVWRWRLRGPFIFWTSIATLCLSHIFGIFIYTMYVGPILVWQWVPLIVIESLVVVFGMDWSTRRFGHRGKAKVE